jgi:hypothetical protein
VSRKQKIDRLLAAVPPSDGIQFPSNPHPFERYSSALRELVVACLHAFEEISGDCPFSWDTGEQRFTFAIDRWECVGPLDDRTPMLLRHRFHLSTKDLGVADELARFRAELARWRTVADAMFKAATDAQTALSNPS